MPADDKYRTEAERFGDLLDKAISGPDPEVSNLTEEEDAELEELWHRQGYDLLVGPYRPVPGQDEAEDFRTMPLDGNRPFLEQFERRAQWDEKCRKWLETEVYTDLELMKDWDPMSVMRAKALAEQDRKAVKHTENLNDYIKTRLAPNGGGKSATPGKRRGGPEKQGARKPTEDGQASGTIRSGKGQATPELYAAAKLKAAQDDLDKLMAKELPVSRKGRIGDSTRQNDVL